MIEGLHTNLTWKPKYILSVNRTTERLANQFSHMPLKLAAGELPEGGFLEPVEFYKTGALQEQCQPIQVPSKFQTGHVKGHRWKNWKTPILHMHLLYKRKPTVY